MPNEQLSSVSIRCSCDQMSRLRLVQRLFFNRCRHHHQPSLARRSNSAAAPPFQRRRPSRTAGRERGRGFRRIALQCVTLCHKNILKLRKSTSADPDLSMIRMNLLSTEALASHRRDTQIQRRSICPPYGLSLSFLLPSHPALFSFSPAATRRRTVRLAEDQNARAPNHPSQHLRSASPDPSPCPRPAVESLGLPPAPRVI
jgi:hypothetical protein